LRGKGNAARQDLEKSMNSFLTDAVAILLIFGIAYCLILLGHGLGW